MPRFSILVATYNAADWLPHCLDSLLNQTERSVQVICIDDCSTDSSAEVIHQYEQRDERVVYLRTTENSGQAVARNLGLTLATGTLTMMVDADDWLAPDCLEQMWRAFSADAEADAIVARLIYWQEGRTWLHERTEKLPHTLTGSDACRYSIDWTLHGCYAIRTEIHRRYPYDTSYRLYSDDNTSRQHYLHCRHVVIGAGRYYYRQHPANSTHQVTRRRFDFVAANDSLRATLERENADASMLAICEDYAWRNYVGLWRTFQRHCSLSPEEHAEVETIFRTSFARFQRLRIPLHTWLRPCFFPWTSYRLFAYWQQLLMWRFGVRH